ncbi:MAG TPA: DUF2269 domain-containing protein [Xanthobacteraceae bacterium]|nr:DUF2269 domain-containing protein [Xanthobacteraceae bacterium]
MLTATFALTFAHIIAMAVVLGTWLGIALFMLFAHRSGNTSVVALTSVFVVRAELWVMAAALVLLPLTGFALALVFEAPLSAYWIEASGAVYAAVVLTWIINLLIEMRIRRLSRKAALEAAPLPRAYRGLFWLWSLFTIAGLAGMIAITALMVWRPEWS